MLNELVVFWLKWKIFQSISFTASVFKGYLMGVPIGAAISSAEIVFQVVDNYIRIKVFFEHLRKIQTKNWKPWLSAWPSRQDMAMLHWYAYTRASTHI